MVTREVGVGILRRELYSFSRAMQQIITNFNSLKQQAFIIPRCLWVGRSPREALGAFCSGSHKTALQAPVGLCSFKVLRLLFSLTWLLAEFRSCDCRTKVPVSSLAVTQSLLSAARGHPRFLARSPLTGSRLAAASFFKVGGGVSDSVLLDRPK